MALSGSGAMILGGEEIPLRAGDVVARPAGTGVAHTLRAGDEELTFLAYGTGHRGDIVYFPRSGKIGLPGLGIIARLQSADYWDGED